MFASRDTVDQPNTAAGGTITGVTKYYQMNGRTVAVRNVTDASGMQTGTLDYFLHDQLGSAVGTLATDGSIASTASYWPYGALRNFTVGLVLATDKLYTGQRAEWGDTALGLYNYNARFYSTTLGTFVSADTKVPSDSSMGLDRFAYADDNPERFTDPTGYDPTQQDLDSCAQSIVACIEWSYGVSPHTEFGLVIVMGLSESNRIRSNLDRYWAYGEAFIQEYVSGCDAVQQCWGAFKDIAAAAGSTAAYDAFGLRFIQSSNGSLPGNLGVAERYVTGVLGLVGIGDAGLGDLDDAIRNTRGKIITGVIGHSEGAGTVAYYFAHHPDVNVPFFLDSYTGLDPRIFYSLKAGTLPNYVGATSFYSCGSDCGRAHHGPTQDLNVAQAVLNDFACYDAFGYANCWD